MSFDDRIRDSLQRAGESQAVEPPATATLLGRGPGAPTPPRSRPQVRPASPR